MSKRSRKKYRRRKWVKQWAICAGWVVGFVVVMVVAGMLIRDGVNKHEINQDEKYRVEDIAEEVDSQEVYVNKRDFLEDTSAYPQELLALVERNPETESFVRNYPEKKDYVSRRPLSEYADCQEVPLLLQWDDRWGYYTYGRNVMGLTGCGPTCLSMVAIYLLGDLNMTPVWMADFCTDNGFCAEGNGTSWELMSTGARMLGLTSTELPLNEKTIKDTLEAGTPIICIMGPGDFTDEGHFIVLTGWEDGMVTVKDPNSRTNSEKNWDFQEIKYQIRNLWAISI